ncbi:MAG: acyl-CoA thioesterase [Pseudonocardia sp.]
MARFVTHVPLRWTDQDSYHHVNHARTVTLLEEARIGLFLDAAAAEGITGFERGLLVAALNVDYRRQIPYRSRTLRVIMWVDEVRAASFRIFYEMCDGPAADARVAVTAWTRMGLVDLDAARPRRVTVEERAFLGRWRDEA